MKYRKLPVVIEAIQWNGSNYSDIERFITVEFGYQTRMDGNGTNVIIPTLEGNMEAIPNDYIIKGVNGEFYPCKPDIFEKTYELAE
jgi:hypothetical protein